MSSTEENGVMASEPKPNGGSHTDAADRPEVCDTTCDQTSSSDLQTNGKALQSTDTTTKKIEAKPVKSNKKLKEEEKKLKLLFKSFEDVDNPESKLDALGRKYLQLVADHRTTEARKDELEKRIEKVVKERDHLQSEYNKASLAKSKLESLCRELQRHSKLVKEESQLRIQEEEAKRKELSEKFQTTINDISEQMQENYKANQQLKNENNDLAARLKGLVEQYEVREEHVEKVFKHKQLELQLAEAKMAQQHLQFDEDKKKTLSENQILIKQAQEYKKQCELLTKQETEMKSQLAMYAERFDEFQKTLNKSNEVFSTFKKEMDKMTKTIKKLEKERNTWKSKCESSNHSLVQMVDEREKLKNEVSALRSKNEKLENLCRALHKGAKETSTDIDQTKGANAAQKSNEKTSSCPVVDKNSERRELNSSAEADMIQNTQTQEASPQEVENENGVHDEENQHSEERSEGTGSVESGNNPQVPPKENSNDSEDFPSNADTPSSTEEDAPKSENKSKENVSSVTENSKNETSTPDGEAS
ncbi:unnamed protein product [Porites lobata]|uniref:Beta-taxilin n=1 Tax=Porites lobata TaxID=104759 RepID=A0ABN8MN34_9CNID|nr:unnamed protein product [Porites lobata]